MEFLMNLGKLFKERLSIVGICHPRGHNDQTMSKPVSTLGQPEIACEGEKERKRRERKEADWVSVPY